MSTAAITTTTSNSSRMTGTAIRMGFTPADVVSVVLSSVVVGSVLAVVTACVEVDNLGGTCVGGSINVVDSVVADTDILGGTCTNAVIVDTGGIVDGGVVPRPRGGGVVDGGCVVRVMMVVGDAGVVMMVSGGQVLPLP